MKKTRSSDSDTHSQTASRRSFLKAAATASGVVVATGLTGCASPRRRKLEIGVPAGSAARRDKLRLAFIGTAGIGGYHLDKTKDLGITCPCFCDVDTNRMGKAAELYPQAARYQDYREMLEREAANIDAVMVGIPDHHHYPASMIAMKLGKHVYTQKPLTHTPWEARQLAKSAKQYGVVSQMGNQGHALEGWRLVYEWIHSGALGHVTETHTWSDRPIWPQGVNRPEGEDPVPSSLNWDVWLGPAPVRPYKAGPAPDKPGPYHWFNWRGWWDFGNGALGDMACHTMDGVFWALDPGYPTSIEPVALTPKTKGAFPKATVIKWKFPRIGKRRAFDAYWYDGGLKPPRPPELEANRNLPRTGNLFIGSKATLMVSGDYGESPRIIPEALHKEIGKPPHMLERSPGHVKEWVMACKGEKPKDFARSNFAYAGPFTESILLGNIALRVGRRIDWDGENMQITNVPDANKYVNKTYREGWKF